MIGLSHYLILSAALFCLGLLGLLTRRNAVHVLMSIEGVEPHYQIIVDRQGPLDVVEVQVEVSENIFSDEVKVLEKLSRQIEREIKDQLGISCKVKLVEPKAIQRSEGKAKRVIDNRKM